MAYNFPNSPSNGDTVTINSITYTYNSTSGAWKTTASAGGGGGGGASVTSSDTAPTNPSAGDLWWSSSEAVLYIYYADGDSSQWVQASTPGADGADGADGVDGASGLNVTTSDTAPTSPSAGDFWWDSDANALFIYYTDATSSQWVQATTPGADGATGATGATGPAGPAGSINILTDVDTTTAAPSTGDLLKWDGTNWVPTPSVGITHQDTWRLSSNVTSDANPITVWTNTPASSTYQTTLGTAMTHGGGVFTFPVTGYWKVEFFAKFNLTTSDNINIGINGFDGSTGISTPLSLATVGDSGYIQAINSTTHINVTNASSSGTRVTFFVTGMASGNSLQTDSTRDATYVMFTRLADAV